MEEVFKKIKGWTWYYVSNMGRIKSTYYGRDVILKQQKNHKNGYMMVVLQEKEKRFNILVHRTVAKYFVPNPNKLPEVNHIGKDENGKITKSDNRAISLEWSTSIDNKKHARENGLWQVKYGKEASGATKVGRYKNGKLVKSYDVISDAIKEGFNRNGISQSINMGCLHNGFTWSYLGRAIRKPRKIQNPICSIKDNKIIATYNTTQEMVDAGFWIGNIYTCLKYQDRKYKGLHWRYKKDLKQKAA